MSCLFLAFTISTTISADYTTLHKLQVTLTMENKQGLFWPLKGFSPSSTSSPMSTLLRRRNKYHLPPPLGATCPSTPVRPLVEAMSPLKEGPEETECSFSLSSSSDLRLLLGVLGAPLAPLHVCTTHPFPHLAIKDTPIVSFSLSSSILNTLNMKHHHFRSKTHFLNSYEFRRINVCVVFGVFVYVSFVDIYIHEF